MTRALSLALLVAACGGPRVGPPAPAGAQASAASFGRVSEILALHCATASCHTGSPPTSAPDSLDPERAYATLVGQPALQVPAMPLVLPGDPDRSYLVLKLRGAASTVGGVSTRMPLNSQPLSDADLGDLESWIAAGAPLD